jgi:hypothetical protein
LNVGEKVTGKKVMDEKLQEKIHKKKSHIYRYIKCHLSDKVFRYGFTICLCSIISFIIVFLTIKNDLCMSVYKHYDNNNQGASFYKRKQLTFTIIKRKWRLYQATEVVPSCVTRGTCIPNMLPGRPISGGSVLNGQA